MAQKQTTPHKEELEAPKKEAEKVEPTVIKEAPVKKVTRLDNEKIISMIKEVTEKIVKERNIRSVKANVLNRENSYQLEGLIRNLNNAVFTFDIFTRPPKAQ